MAGSACDTTRSSRRTSRRFAELVLPTVVETGLKLIMEPGRFIVGNAAVLLTKVLYRKHSGGKDYVVADAGMTELLRPSHYGAYHRILAMQERGDASTVDVVGPSARAAIFSRSIASSTTCSRAIVSSCATSARTGSPWRPTTTADCVPPRCWWMATRIAVITAREEYADLSRLEIAHPEWKRERGT